MRIMSPVPRPTNTLKVWNGSPAAAQMPATGPHPNMPGAVAPGSRPLFQGGNPSDPVQARFVANNNAPARTSVSARPAMAVAPSRQAMSPRGFMMGGNTEVAPGSMKAETFEGRNENIACKKKFKAGAFCERD